jgi:HAD superfamily hydrolase (TIGR01509 family)
VAAAALVFDLDGTLCDSRPWYADIFVDRHGAERDAVHSRLVDGCPPVKLASDLGFSKQALLRSCESAVADLALYPGVIRTLNTLTEREIPMGLVTGVSGRFAQLILESFGLRSYFSSVVTAEFRLQPKPHPAGLLRALREIDVAAGPEIYYVGDLSSDAGAATRAGISFAWAAYGYGPEQPIETTATLQRFADVLKL